MKTRAVLMLAAVVLLTALALQFIRFRDMTEGERAVAARPIDLKNQIPAQLAGWVVSDEPLGPNEAVRGAIERTLNYDDYVYRLYRRGGVTVGLYAAYWAPNRMPVQKVASHTPDRCWIENGWTCLDQRFAEKITTSDTRLQSAQWRIFQAPGRDGRQEHVLYWHLVGAQVHDYGGQLATSPGIVGWWRDALAYALAGSRAQLFVRVTSSVPFERLHDEAGWKTMVEALAGLGLAAAPGA
ncbi:MAG: exosortase-associated EpsI family protein [Opitutaceae bacterium]|nr:exosortase-associated EpsI family protein [Opitutaceae bacterium]